MDLTEYFNSLQPVDKPYNKYAAYSLAFNNPYRIATGYDAFRNNDFDAYLKDFIAQQGKCIVMPNMLNNEVIGLVFRSLQSKQFRYYTKYRYIPYGAGFNTNKQYYNPWLIVESALDSDFIRNFYPYVISTNGVSVSNTIMNFLKNTCSTLYIGFDFDKAGWDSYNKLYYKHDKYASDNKEFHIKRFETPVNFDGKHLKDFGEILDCLYNKNIVDYDNYVSSLKYSLTYLTL